MWHHLTMRGNASAIYAIVEELDLIITQMKALHALADCGRRGVRQGARRSPRRCRSRAPAARSTALLRRGWLERREDAHDRRMKRVGITESRPRGHRTHRQRPPRRHRAVHRLPDPRAARRASRPPSPTSPITHDPHSQRHHRRQPPLVDPRRDVLRAVHDHARQHGRERGPAGDPEGPALVDQRPGMDRQRLHAELRRPARHRRAAGRHLRPPQDVPLRRHRLRPLERLHRALPERGLAGRRARGAGRRRRVHDAGDPLDHHQRLPGARARQGDRDLGRRQRPGAGHRPRGRRLPGRERLLAVDLLPQRAGGRRWPSS